MSGKVVGLSVRISRVIFRECIIIAVRRLVHMDAGLLGETKRRGLALYRGWLKGRALPGITSLLPIHLIPEE